MTREIKFRAWDNVQKEWQYVFLEEKGSVRFRYAGGISLPENRENWMQFTGLLDKNGKEIYEGDILKSNFGRIAPVVWYRRGFFVKAESLPNRVTDFLVWEQSEVIGNIYENPELLKP